MLNDVRYMHCTYLQYSTVVLTWSARAAEAESPHPTLHGRACSLTDFIDIHASLTVMARLSTSQAYAESEASGEEQSVSAEVVMDSEEEGAMEEHSTPKRRRLNADASRRNGKESRSSHQGTMGQGESREAVMERNAALRRAGQQAREPRGKLPRLSGGPSYAPSSRRKLPGNKLASANTFDLLSDDENEGLPNKVRLTPIQRAAQQRPNPWYKSPAQTLIDQQLGLPVDEEEEGEEQDEVESQIQEEEEDESVVEQAQIDEQLGFPPNEEEEGAEQDEVKSQIHEDDEPVAEQPQQSGSGKKRLGRPPKPIQSNGDGKRKRGRPSKQKQPEHKQSVPAPTGAIQPPDANVGNENEEPSTPTAAPRRKPERPTKAASAAGTVPVRRCLDSNIHIDPRTTADIVGVNRRRSARVRGDNVRPTTEPRPTMPVASKATRQPAKDLSRAMTNNRGRQASASATNHNVEHQLAQPVVIDDDEYDDQAHDTSEEPEENGESEEENDSEAKPDAHRLYGQWGRIQGIIREATKHRDEVASIPDDTFTSVLRECREVRRKVRATAIDISPDDLNKITSDCRNAVHRADAICGDTSQVPNRDDRGYHIFKFLIPALARLLKVVVEAFERVDIEGAGQSQISMRHLVTVINLVYATYNCGDKAKQACTNLDQDRPIKRAVHSGITIPLRDLHAALTEVHQRIHRAEKAREQVEYMAREIAARDEKREREKQERKQREKNQAKWNKMNKLRQEISKDIFDEEKFLHLRKWNNDIVGTAEDGRPFLPAHLRAKVSKFTMLELAYLQEGLEKYGDTPWPLESEVFEKLMVEHCRCGGALAERNLLEIVIKANDYRDYIVHSRRMKDEEPPEWVWLVPAWIESREF